MDFVILLFLCFTFLGVVLAILFLLKRTGDRFANRLLALYGFLFATELLNNVLRWSGEIGNPAFVHLHLAHFPLWTMYGPLVFLYVRRVVTRVKWKVYDILFLIPTWVIVAILFPFYSKSTAEKVEILANGNAFDYVAWPGYGIWFVIALMTFYAFLTYFSFWKNPKIDPW